MQPIYLHEEVAVVFVEPRHSTPMPDCCGRVFITAARAEVNVLLISSASSTGAISFVVPNTNVNRLLALLRTEFQEELKRCRIETIRVQQPAIMLSGRTDGFGLVRELAARHINILSIAHRHSDAGTTSLIVQAYSDEIIDVLNATGYEWYRLNASNYH